jgi:enamine deaminase RidA (YjgF/YER057c/UK114 family)
MEKIILEPQNFPWFDYKRYSFSLGLAVGESCYLSGHTASTYDPERKRIVVEGGMAQQARVAYAKAAAILESGGKSFADVVRVVEYVTPQGIERYAEAEAVRREIFGSHRPAVNTVPIKALLRPDAFIEIEAMAGPAGTATPAAGDGTVTRETGDLIILPSISAAGAGGDLVAQISAVFDEAARILGALGLGLENLVKTVDYLTPAAFAGYRETAAVRRERLGPIFPAATGIVVPRLMHPDDLIQIDMIATRATPIAVNPGWARYDRLTYSPAVRAGHHLFLAGQGAVDPESGEMRHAGDVVGQADLIYRNILAILEAAGGGPENLVKTVEFTTTAALARYREVADVRKALLSLPYPASTGPVCEAMVRPEMVIEVDATAVLG